MKCELKRFNFTIAFENILNCYKQTKTLLFAVFYIFYLKKQINCTTIYFKPEQKTTHK